MEIFKKPSALRFERPFEPVEVFDLRPLVNFVNKCVSSGCQTVWDLEQGKVNTSGYGGFTADSNHNLVVKTEMKTFILCRRNDFRQVFPEWDVPE